MRSALVILAGIGLVAVGIAVGSRAFQAQERFPPAPPLLLKLRITKSDRGWAWRYRTFYGGTGLILIFWGGAYMVTRHF